MAYLKSSQITGLSPKAIDTTGFTQADSINLGDRAYTEHEVLLADAFSVTGDVTISDNLILAKLSDDGEAITVTGDASTTRTISGSGSLEGSTFAQTPNASLTSMTGVLGSGVTGGSGLTDGSSLTSLGTVTTGTFNGTLDSTTFSGDAGQKTAKAWMRFDGAAATVGDSFNMTSLTDNGAGDYTVTFAQSMNYTQYCASITAIHGTGQNDFQDTVGIDYYNTNVRIYTGYVTGTDSSSAAHDVNRMVVIIFGD